jgi:hypothetical protein
MTLSLTPFCEFPCVRFQSVVWSSVPLGDTSTCPSDRQHSGLGGWLSLPTRSFRSGLLLMFSCCRSCSVWRNFHPQNRQTFTGAPHLPWTSHEPGLVWLPFCGESHPFLGHQGPAGETCGGLTGIP